jgi:hypothetical protein
MHAAQSSYNRLYGVKFKHRDNDDIGTESYRQYLEVELTCSSALFDVQDNIRLSCLNFTQSWNKNTYIAHTDLNRITYDALFATNIFP